MKLDLIPKQLKQVQKMAYKLHQRQWCDMLVWRPEQSQNQSAMSALVRQILHGFEVVCLNPSLLFAAVEHVSGVIDEIQLSIPIQSLSQPCRLTPLLKIHPGLVHFVLIDRKNHRMISPRLSLERIDSSFENVSHTSHKLPIDLSIKPVFVASTDVENISYFFRMVKRRNAQFAVE